MCKNSEVPSISLDVRLHQPSSCNVHSSSIINVHQNGYNNSTDPKEKSALKVIVQPARKQLRLPTP